MKKSVLTVSILGMIVLLFPCTVYANSSWNWLTDTTPLLVLPFAIVFTLVVEIFSIVRYGKVKKYLKVAIVVLVANLISFLIPYLFEISGLPDPSIFEAIKAGLYYIVTFGYIIITLFFELPIVFFSLWNNTTHSGRLLLAIVVSNVITTVLVAICERLFCIPATY